MKSTYVEFLIQILRKKSYLAKQCLVSVKYLLIYLHMISNFLTHPCIQWILVKIEIDITQATAELMTIVRERIKKSRPPLFVTKLDFFPNRLVIKERCQRLSKYSLHNEDVFPSSEKITHTFQLQTFYTPTPLVHLCF